jgi:hypothetical protein
MIWASNLSIMIASKKDGAEGQNKYDIRAI